MCSLRPSLLATTGLLGLLLACGGGSEPAPAPPVVTPPAVVPSVTKVTNLAGVAGNSGGSDGFGGVALFSGPGAMVEDAAGNLFLTDEGSNSIRKIKPNGDVLTVAGQAGTVGSTDGIGGAARFDGPSGLAMDAAGNLFVADYRNHTIRKVTPAGEVSTFAGVAQVSGAADGQGSAARFCYPIGLAVDASGNLYVADAGNQLIRKVTPGGLVSTLAGTLVAGTKDGPVATAQLNRPFGLAVAPDGTVYFSEFHGHVIRKISGGMVTTVAGSAGTQGSVDGTGAVARFSSPAMISLDAAGAIYVADYQNHLIRKVTGNGVTTVAGMAGEGGYGVGAARATHLSNPYGCLVSGRRVYITNRGSYVVQILD